MNWRQTFLTAAVVIILATGALGVLAVTQTARNDTVVSLRHGCLRNSARLVLLANTIRSEADSAQAIAAILPNHAARTSLGHEKAAARRAVLELDRSIDPLATGGLNTGDRVVIRELTARGAAFSCKRAYPTSGLLP